MPKQAFRSPYIIGGVMIVFGVLMWLADRASTARNGLDQMTGFDAITVGLRAGAGHRSWRFAQRHHPNYRAFPRFRP